MFGPQLAQETFVDGGTAQGALAAALGTQYALERELGHGGMATVYLARDLRHRRLVAVKVLHPELSAVLGPERFLKEIELTASLQHPHILPLFDSGSAGGLLYYVMPYVEGEALRARLEREQQLPVADAVRIASEVAAALDYAHRRGVVHRDVKPENILLHDGSALVADFGIALAIQQAGGARMTQTGLSLGTPQYMAPEQAMGERTVDARADVYALGAVLYEMLAGEPPFTGPSAQAIVARVMTERPRPLDALRDTVPPHVEVAVRTALAKLPADRFPSAAAFAAALAPSATVSGAALTSAGAPSTARRRRSILIASVAAGALAVAMLAAGVALGPRMRTALPDAEPLRFAIEPDSGVLRLTPPAIAPDGRTVVYAAESQDGVRLYARRMHELEGRALAGTDGGEWPFFSPDGAWVGFYSDGAVRKVRLEGGQVSLVTEVPAPATFHGAAWGANDEIYYATGTSAVYRVAATGGAADRIAVRDSAVRVYSVQPLPGGDAVLVTLSQGWNSGQLGTLDLASGRVRQLGAGYAPRHTAGYLSYGTAAGELYRQPFDVDRLQLTGEAERLAGGVQFAHSAVPAYDVSRNGTLVYRLGFPATPEMGRMTLVDRTGRELQAFPARSPWTPRYSPDGNRIVYGANAPGHSLSDLWVTDLAAGTTERVTTDGKDRDNNDPDWSPDGRSLVYSAVGEGAPKDMFVRALDRATTRRITRRSGTEWPSDWSPDGAAMLFTGGTLTGDFDIWTQPADGGQPHPYLATAATEQAARVSPDGRWVAYTSNETGRDEVYVQSFPTAGQKTLISSRGGVHPMWRRDGRELYYWQEDQLIAATIGAGAAGEPPVVRGRTPLFRAAYVQNAHPNYDVSSDGSRFVVVTGPARANRLVVALQALNAGVAGKGGR